MSRAWDTRRSATRPEILASFAPQKGDEGIFRTSFHVRRRAQLHAFYDIMFPSTPEGTWEAWFSSHVFSGCGKPWCKFMGSGTEMPRTSPGQITSRNQDSFFSCAWGHKLWNVPTPGLDTLFCLHPATACKCPVGVPKCWGNAVCPRLTCLRGELPGGPPPRFVPLFGGR